MDQRRLLRHRRRGAAHPLLLTLFGCTPPAPADLPPEPAPDGHLVYVQEVDGTPSVWSVAAAGGPARPLPAVAPAAFPGEVRPGGGEVVVIGVEEGPGGRQESLWAVPLRDGRPRLLAPPAGRLRSPTWAADGASLVVEADWRSFGDLYRVVAAGGEPARLTTAPNGSFEPTIAGGRLAFASSRAGNAEVYLGAADPDAAEVIAPHPGNDTRPRPSPDGTRVAWLSDRDGSAAVWLGGDGAPRRLRPPGGGVDLDHAWSPDGTRLAVTVQRGAREVAIEVVEVATATVLATVDGPGVDEHPAWSPDGRWLAFDSARTGDVELWLVKADGSKPRALTERPGPDWLPRWAP